MHPNHFRTLFLLLWLLAIPASLYPFHISDTSRIIPELNGAPDSVKIDLLLKISEELLPSQPEDAFGYAGEALKLAEKTRDAVRIGNSYCALGGFYMVTAIYDKALENYMTALQRFIENGDSLRMARCYDQIGQVYTALGDLPTAGNNYRTALAINKAKSYHPQIAVNYMNLGLNYLKADSVDKGLSYLLVSLMIADSLHMDDEKMVLMKNIGFAYARIGKHNEALSRFYKVLELLGEQPDDYTRADAQLNIARGYQALANYPAALKYARLSFDLSREHRFDHITRDAAETLSDIYAARGDYQQAYSYVKIYRDLSDTILNADRIAQLARLQTLYDVKGKEQENRTLRNQVFQSVKKMRAGTMLIIMITLLVIILGISLFLLNRMNNRYARLNKKLAAQSHELETLNDMKDKFFSFVAHNLKNPFNTIMGFSELLHRAADANDVNKAREYSGLIYDLSMQVQKVLSNLLEWSRLQRRTFEVKFETVELTGLIKDVAEMNNKEAARKDISLGLSSESDVFVVADRTMITAVLQNLVSNAIQFTPPSGKITIHCKVKDQITEVSITDTGIGMLKEKMDKLFDFDFTHNRQRNSDHGGSGLGLVICHEMLTKNGGTIRVESEPGKGSTFTFTLPVAIRHDKENEADHEHAEKTPEDIAENLLKSEAPVNAALMNDLRINVIPQYEEVTRVLSIEELEHFARTLIATGEKFNHVTLEGYGRSLQSLTTGHQVDQIIKILPRFGDFLKKTHVM